MRLTFWHILAGALIIFGLSYYFIPFVRYLLIPFSGGTKAPESLMIRFLEVNTAIDTQTNEQIFANRSQQVATIDQVPEQAGWINSKALDLDDLYEENKSVLIYFWSSCCMKCLRAVPYIQDFWNRYKDHGLVVIGVHTPFFEFEKNPRVIFKEIERSHITYPVATDGNKKIWKKFGNHFCPALYLINPQGIIVYTHFGEGNQSQTEHAICQSLKKSGHTLPATKKPVAYLDPIIRRCTQELHAGAKTLHKPFGNAEQPIAKHTILFTLPIKIEPDKIYIQGMYYCDTDHVQNKTEGTIIVNYLANAPYLVLAPADEKTPLLVEVLLDDQPIPTEIQGTDIKDIAGKKIMIVDQARIYYPLMHKAPYGRHTITLKAPPGLKFYSINFGTY